MKYTVVWTPSAEQDLAAVWLNAANRNAVTSAAHTIDGLLGQDPETRGTLRFDSVRTLLVPPLGVDFEVVEPDRIVYVLTIWDVTKNGSP
jgi:hypothetical protein